MNTAEFGAIMQKLDSQVFPDMYDKLHKNSMEHLKVLKQSSLSGDELALALSFAVSSDAMRKAVLASLMIAFDVKPDPFDPKTYFHIVK
ncbi:MAG: hypothetical protein WED82_13280 [Balneolales bacterium]